MREGLRQKELFTAETLLEKLWVLDGPELRSFRIWKWIESVGPRRGAIWFEWLCEVASGTGSLREKARIILSELPWVRVRLGTQGVKAIGDVARRMGLIRTEGLMAEALPTQQEVEDGQQLTYLRGLTLGERRALARGRFPRWLERLLWDPDPIVIRRLLSNPRITETEVLKIASRTPVNPAILREVALSGRWMNRYRVKLALVLNPSCPRSISMALVEVLLVQDLKKVLDKSDLDKELREKARALLMGRVAQQAQSQGIDS